MNRARLALEAELVGLGVDLATISLDLWDPSLWCPACWEQTPRLLGPAPGGGYFAHCVRCAHEWVTT